MEGPLKSSYNDVISPVDFFFNQWDPSTAILMEEVSRLQERLKNKPHLVTFHEYLGQPMNFSADSYTSLFLSM